MSSTKKLKILNLAAIIIIAVFLIVSIYLDIPFAITSIARIIIIILAAVLFGLKGSASAIVFTTILLIYYNYSMQRAFFSSQNIVGVINYLIIGISFGVARDVYIRQKSDLLSCAQGSNTANDELSDAKELLDTILNTIPAYIYVRDKDLRFVKVNRAFEELVKKRSEEIIGKTDYDMHVKDIAARMQEDDREVIKKDEPKLNIEEHVPYPEKGYVWQIANKLPLHDKNGHVAGIVGITYDITELKKVQAQMEALLDSFPHMAWLKDAEGRYLAVNRLFTEFLSLSKEELIGNNDFDLDLYPDELAKKYRDDDLAIMKDKKERFLEEYIHAGGKSRLHETFKTPVIDESGKVIGTAGYSRDITEVNKNIKEIKRLNNLLDSIIDNAPIMLFLKDAQDLKFKMINKATEEILGINREEMIDKSDHDFFPKRQADHFAQKDKLVLENKNVVSIAEESIKTREGRKFLRTKKVPILDTDGRPRYMLGISEEITKQKEMEKIIKRLAYYDDITGLPNRNLFRERLSFAIELAKRNKKKLMIVMLDFDKFKEINDTYGHDIGDKLLKSFSNRAKKIMRKTDTFARFGGDEFAMCLVDFSNIDDMEKFALKIITVFKDPFRIGSLRLSIKGSIGISVYPDDALTMSDLIKFSDIAMYEAKRQGGSRHMFYNDLEDKEGKIERY